MKLYNGSCSSYSTVIALCLITGLDILLAPNLLVYLLLLLVVGFAMGFLPPRFSTHPNIAEDKPPVANRRMVVWRWVFLCALTALITLLCIKVLCNDRRGIIVNLLGDLCPREFHGSIFLAESFLGIVFAVTTIFLLFASPFFFLRFRGLAIMAWFIATIAALCLTLPTF